MEQSTELKLEMKFSIAHSNKIKFKKLQPTEIITHCLCNEWHRCKCRSAFDVRFVFILVQLVFGASDENRWKK